MASSWLLLLGALQASAAPAELVVTLGVVLPEGNLGHLSWARQPRVEPALRLALEALEPRLRAAGHAFRMAFAFAPCEDERGIYPYRNVSDTLRVLKESHSPDVLLGPSCNRLGRSVGVFASRGGLPFLMVGVFASSVSVEVGFSTTVYAGPVGPSLGVFLALLHQHFNWTSRAAVIFRLYTDGWRHYSSLLDTLDRLLGAAPNFTVDSHVYDQPEAAVRFLQEKARVVYIYGPVELFHEILCLAQDHNMTTGDYIFIYLDPFVLSLRPEEVAAKPCKAAKSWQRKESQDPRGLQEALQSVLVITPHEPQTPEYRRFQSQLILRAQRDFGVVLNDSRENLMAGCFHDGLLLYATALNETLHEGGAKRETGRILDKMRGQTFKGVTGTVSINSDGDREMDFDLRSVMDVESGEYQVVGHYVGSEERIEWLRPICWVKGRPPLDNPPCVFDKEDPSCVLDREDPSSGKSRWF